MIDLFGTSLDTAAALTGSSVGIIWLLRTLWRRLSKDNNEVVKDRVEINIIETMLAQQATLSAENLALRTRESDLSLRLGRLESKEYEVENLLLRMERMQLHLDEKDNRIEELLMIHSSENAKMLTLLTIKDNEIRELYTKIWVLEEKLEDRKWRRQQ